MLIVLDEVDARVEDVALAGLTELLLAGFTAVDPLHLVDLEVQTARGIVGRGGGIAANALLVVLVAVRVAMKIEVHHSCGVKAGSDVEDAAPRGCLRVEDHDADEEGDCDEVLPACYKASGHHWHGVWVVLDRDVGTMEELRFLWVLLVLWGLEKKLGACAFFVICDTSFFCAETFVVRLLDVCLKLLPSLALLDGKRCQDWSEGLNRVEGLCCAIF